MALVVRVMAPPMDKHPVDPLVAPSSLSRPEVMGVDGVPGTEGDATQGAGISLGL
jgi:hypothetical protein